MTKLTLPRAETPIHILKKPYSVEQVGDFYEYQIMTYGFEHLIPKVLAYELKHGLTHLLHTMDTAPLSAVLFELPLNTRVGVDQIQSVFSAAKVLDLEYIIHLDRLIITKITPLRKLLKAEDPLKVAHALLAVCFTGCQFEYSTSRPGTSSLILDFEKVNPIIARNLSRLYPLHKGTTVQVPVHFLHFSTVQECMLYTLEYLYPDIEVDQVITQTTHDIKSSFSFLKLLRVIGINEHYFLNIRNCEACTPLANPLSTTYSTFCRNPFECDLNKGALKLTTGWAVIQDRVYIWTRDTYTRDNLKLCLKVGLSGLQIKDRLQNTNRINQLWIDGVLRGSIIDHHTGIHLFTLKDPESLVV